MRAGGASTLGERSGAWLRHRGGIARLDTTSFGRHVAVQRRYGASVGNTGGGWWKDALLAAVILYMALTTFLLLRRGFRSAPSAFELNRQR